MVDAVHINSPIPDHAWMAIEALEAGKHVASDLDVARQHRDEDGTHLSFTRGAGHGGSHPHLVHEFVSALVEQREPFPNARRSANWTCVRLPEFTPR